LSTARQRSAFAVIAAVMAGVVMAGAMKAGDASAAGVSAGWAVTDVGLHEDGDGLVLGLGSRTTLKPATLDLVYALEYVQKRGAQPTWFADPVDFLVLADAEVTLHVLQPVALVELTSMSMPWPRPYAGLSVALKVSEQWSDFPGEPSSEWGYKDLDFAAHLGLTREVGPVRLDVRYSQGLSEQLVADPTAGAPAKAEDPLPGVDEPSEGARLSHWQATAALKF
jgi:hypothetical protein